MLYLVDPQIVLNGCTKKVCGPNVYPMYGIPI